jgi:hypothetical protein
MSDQNQYPELDATLRLHHDTAPEPDLAPIRREVLTRIAASDHKRTPARKLVLATAGLAVIAAVTTTVVVWPDAPRPADVAAGAGPGAVSADEAAIAAITNAADLPVTMNLLIQRVAKAQPLTVAQGGYLYTSSRGSAVRTIQGPDGPAHYWSDELNERWTSITEGYLPKFTRYTYNVNSRPLSEADRVKLVKYGVDYAKQTTHEEDFSDPRRTGPRDPTPRLHNPTPEFLASLPRDPAALKALLLAQVARADQPDRTDYLLYKEIIGLIHSVDALLTPEFRAAIYQILAETSGMTRIPGRTDLAGRAGVAVARQISPGYQAEIILDPDTSRVIGSRTLLTEDRDGLPAGMVLGSSTTDQKVVTKVGEK